MTRDVASAAAVNGNFCSHPGAVVTVKPRPSRCMVTGGSPRASRARKIGWTIVVLALTWLTAVSLVKSWDFFKEFQSLLQSVYGT